MLSDKELWIHYPALTMINLAVLYPNSSPTSLHRIIFKANLICIIYQVVVLSSLGILIIWACNNINTTLQKKITVGNTWLPFGKQGSLSGYTPLNRKQRLASSLTCVYFSQCTVEERWQLLEEDVDANIPVFSSWKSNFCGSAWVLYAAEQA